MMNIDTSYFDHPNKIFWASRRGMLELDLILVPFAKNHYSALSAEERETYHQLLLCEDTELFAWFLRRERPEVEALANMVDRVLASAE